jgi:hypothetical protein
VAGVRAAEVLVSERAPYSRVYWSIIDDPKFESIYCVDAHLAAWLRLLLIADQAHPASAHLPATLRRPSITALVNVGLVDLLPGGRYRIHGLSAERLHRSAEQRNGGDARVETAERGVDGRFLPSTAGPAVVTSGGPSGGNQRNQLRRDETRRDEKKTPPSPPRPDVIALESFGYKVTTKRLAVLDEVASHHDITGYEWAAAIIRANPTDAIGAVMAADQEWKAGRRREADDADAAWATLKAADKRPRVVA